MARISSNKSSLWFLPTINGGFKQLIVNSSDKCGAMMLAFLRIKALFNLYSKAASEYLIWFVLVEP